MGKGDFTSTLRVAGFAQSAHLIELGGFIPVVGPLARVTAIMLAVIGLWLGVVVTHDLKGWRTILLPVIYILTTIVAIVFIVSAMEGLVLTLDRFMEAFGLVR